MSALLFIICVEILALNIRNDKSINGIIYGKYEHKICQYADDATIFVRDMASIPVVLNLINNFSRLAGPKLNLKNPKGLWLGHLKNLGIRIKHDIVWTCNPIKCLGIYVGHKLEKCYQYNWLDKIEKVKKVLNTWSKRQLSLFGKIKVIKTFALSKVIFSATMLLPSDQITKQLEMLFHHFLWGKRDRIKRSILTNDVESGGLNMPNIEKFFMSLRAGWIARTLRSKGKWRAGFEMLATKCNVSFDYLLKMSFKSVNSMQILQTCNPFYSAVLVAYNTCKSIKNPENMSAFEILNQPLFGNHLLKACDKCLFFKEWINSKVLYIKDLINVNGTFKSDHDLYQEIKCKKNIIQQLYVIKNYVYKKFKSVDFSIAPFAKITRSMLLLFNGKLFDIKDQKSNFFYMILNNKSERCKMESVYSREFNIEGNRDFWKKIYVQKVKEIKIIKLSEFNFKLLHNIIPCGKILCKWKDNISEKCILCNDIETVKHMLYECKNVQKILDKASHILKFEIKWKCIVIGMPKYKCSTLTMFYNLLFSIIAYAIFKENSHCKFAGIDYNSVDLKNAVIRNLLFYDSLFKSSTINVHRLFMRFIEKF